MDSHFEEIIGEKISNLVANRLSEPALEGLSQDIQVKAKTAVLVWQLELEFHLSSTKLKDFVEPLPWMDELTDTQMMQVSDYIRSTGLNPERTNTLNWYPREHRFRYERLLSPVASR